MEAYAYVGCSGWFYWKWRGQFYPTDLPTGEWFDHYATRFDTVEINASFYSWPTVTNVESWFRQPGKRSFVYTVKVCELMPISSVIGWAAFCSSSRRVTVLQRRD
nr:DUF72 domain-containing protein [Mesorhizobium amorphae]